MQFNQDITPDSDGRIVLRYRPPVLSRLFGVILMILTLGGLVFIGVLFGAETMAMSRAGPVYHIVAAGIRYAPQSLPGLLLDLVEHGLMLALFALLIIIAAGFIFAPVTEWSIETGRIVRTSWLFNSSTQRVWPLSDVAEAIAHEWRNNSRTIHRVKLKLRTGELLSLPPVDTAAEAQSLADTVSRRLS